MSNERDTPAYVGICGKCGSMRAVIVDDADTRTTLADDVADMIRSGLHVERWTVAKVRSSDKVMKCQQPDSKGRCLSRMAALAAMESDDQEDGA